MRARPKALFRAVVGIALVAHQARAQDLPLQPVPSPPAAPPGEPGPDDSEPAGTLSLWLLGPQGPAGEAEIRITLLYRSGASRAIELCSGANGWLRLRGLPAGVLRGVAISAGGASEVVTLGDSVGNVSVLRAPLARPGTCASMSPQAEIDPAPSPPAASGVDAASPAGTLTVWVLDPNGPAAGAEVLVTVLLHDGRRIDLRTRTGPSGFATVRELPTLDIRGIGVTGEMVQASERLSVGPDSGRVAVLRSTQVLGSITLEGGAFARPRVGSPPQLVPDVRSQLEASAPPRLTLGAEDPSELWHRGASMRSTGQVLTILGAIVFIAGFTIMAGVFGYPDDTHEAFSQIYLGGVVSFVGLAGLGVGIPFWAIGGFRMGKAERMGYVPQ